jgi:hypothetical protein
MTDVIHELKEDQDYEARGVVMRAEVIGHFTTGIIRTPIYRYISLDCGPNVPSIIVEYVGQAPRNALMEIDVRSLRQGDILINPGFIYRKIEWTGPLMNAHLNALKFYKPKSIIKAEAVHDEPAVDLGIIKSDIIQ